MGSAASLVGSRLWQTVRWPKDACDGEGGAEAPKGQEEIGRDAIQMKKFARRALEIPLCVVSSLGPASVNLSRRRLASLRDYACLLPRVSFYYMRVLLDTVV